FLFNAPPTTEIYTLSLHDALPILPSTSDPATPDCPRGQLRPPPRPLRVQPARRPLADPGDHPAGRRAGYARPGADRPRRDVRRQDRKSTRLNSSHVAISYAVFCLK